MLIRCPAPNNSTTNCERFQASGEGEDTGLLLSFLDSFSGGRSVKIWLRLRGAFRNSDEIQEYRI